jgi:hypothetical protein
VWLQVLTRVLDLPLLRRWQLGHGTRGATVYLLCRNKERGEKAVENIRTKTGNPNVSLEVSFLAPL